MPPHYEVRKVYVKDMRASCDENHIRLLNADTKTLTQNWPKKIDLKRVLDVPLHA